MQQTFPVASPYQTLTITDIKTEAPGVKTFFLAPETGQQISYKAGQYLTFILPEHAPEVRRSYSITSTPVLNEPLAIGVKRMENGIFSRYLSDRAKAADKLIPTGAAGFFTRPININN